MKIIDTRPKEINFVLWGHWQNLLDVRFINYWMYKLNVSWICTKTIMCVRPSVTSLSENVHNSWTTCCILITFACICISAFPDPTFFGWRFAEHRSSVLWSASENSHTCNSLTLWDIWIKFCMLKNVYIVQPLVCKMRWGFAGHHFRAYSFF